MRAAMNPHRLVYVERVRMVSSSHAFPCLHRWHLCRRVTGCRPTERSIDRRRRHQYFCSSVVIVLISMAVSLCSYCRNVLFDYYNRHWYLSFVSLDCEYHAFVALRRIPKQRSCLSRPTRCRVREGRCLVRPAGGRQRGRRRREGKRRHGGERSDGKTVREKQWAVWWEVNCTVMVTPFWESITSFWYFVIAIPTGEKKNNRKVNNNLTSVWASTMVMLMLCHLYSTVSRLRSIVPFLFVPVLWWQSRHLDLSW